ncbi:FxLYD domain-containing protein [Natronococcus sp. A-GB7]|uniref:FxLYD domain-containing protein n=1 Tax=Natronococcus sp. A-GB7 TaxID=3037649 RepID=UPI00241D998E|nr:FxLYD domain-containing protein [Natronococcus sp. A-GB7]MDG5817476.1 FxLYD domain-containing protein [Natronococcus sp. A-GB7]
MDRRNVLLGGSVVLTSVLAGCASDDDNGDDEYQDGDGNGDEENGGDGNGGDENGDDDDETDDGGEEELDEEDVEGRDEGEDVLEFGDLEILEHELVIEEDEFSDDIEVEGIIENTGDEQFDYVEVGVRIYDPDGHQLDRYMTNTQDLDGDQTWAFEIMILEDAEDVDDYDIGVSGSQY